MGQSRGKRAKRSSKGAKPRSKATKPPAEAETPGITSSKRSTRKSRLPAEQVELLEKLTVVALSAVEPTVKLIEMLTHLRR